jgi:hypothetical protein
MEAEVLGSKQRRAAKAAEDEAKESPASQS